MSDIREKRISGLTVRIIRENCIGTGSCNHIAPEVFVLDAQQTIEFTEATPDIERDRLIDACDVCPVDALDILDDNGESLIS